MSVSSLQSNEELGLLIVSNKELVQEKKELHAKRLKTFTEKILKLGQLGKLARDSEESEYIQSKIRALEERQNKEIAKLSNIQLIEREINSYIRTEGSPAANLTEDKRCNSAGLMILREQLRDNAPSQPITAFDEKKIINFSKKQPNKENKGKDKSKDNTQNKRDSLKNKRENRQNEMGMQESIKEERRLMQRIDELEYHVAQLEQTIGILQEKCSEAEERLQTKQQSQLFLSSKLQSIQCRIHQGEQSINVNRSILSQLEIKLMLSIDKMNEAEANCNQYRISIQELEQRRSEIDQSIIFYERETSILLDSKQKLQLLMKQEKDYHSELANENEQLLTKNKHLSEQNAQLTLAIARKEEEASQLALQIRLHKAEIQEGSRLIRVQDQNLKLEIMKLKAQISDYGREKECKEELLAELAARHEQQNQEFIRLSEAKEEFETVLRQIIQKKEKLMEEIQGQSNELSRIYNLLEEMKDSMDECDISLKSKNQELEKSVRAIEQCKQEMSQSQLKLRQVSEEVEEKIEEENNILGRIAKLRQIETKMSINVSLKGKESLCDEQIQKRIKEIVEEISSMADLKNKLKECRYQNRRLKLENERMAKQLYDSDLSSI